MAGLRTALSSFSQDDNEEEAQITSTQQGNDTTLQPEDIEAQRQPPMVDHILVEGDQDCGACFKPKSKKPKCEGCVLTKHFPMSDRERYLKIKKKVPLKKIKKVIKKYKDPQAVKEKFEALVEVADIKKKSGGILRLKKENDELKEENKRLREQIVKINDQLLQTTKHFMSLAPDHGNHQPHVPSPWNGTQHPYVPPPCYGNQNAQATASGALNSQTPASATQTAQVPASTNQNEQLPASTTQNEQLLTNLSLNSHFVSTTSNYGPQSTTAYNSST